MYIKFNSIHLQHFPKDRKVKERQLKPKIKSNSIIEGDKSVLINFLNLYHSTIQNI